MSKEIRNRSESVRARLFNIAKAQNVDFDFLLLRYFQERFLYRLSKSKFSDVFVLKGGLLLVLLNIPKTRVTVDVDFLVRNIKNNVESISLIFKIIADMQLDDGVIFNTDTIKHERIKEDADYEGIRYKLEVRLGQIKKQLQFDLGFGDVITPNAKLVEFPVVLDGEHPKLMVYPMETVIAEKFEAMVKLDIANSRMKDFYDIYIILHSCVFFGEELSKAIRQTFSTRGTTLEAKPEIFLPIFYDDLNKQIQWQAFIRKTKVSGAPAEFKNVVLKIKTFISPVIQLSVKNIKWSNIKAIWE